MPSFDDSVQARKIAAVVAAVQAYLDGEGQVEVGVSERGGMSAWRRVVRQVHHDSWTGRG